MYANDPFGAAILDFHKNPDTTENIIVEADLCDDDIIPTAYLFRTFDEMPKLEQLALENCKGKVLDIGAGAGCHSKWLQNNNFDVTALEKSPGACIYLQRQNINTIQTDFWEYDQQRYDTLLILMNGIGLAGKINRLPAFFDQLKKMLNVGGKIIIDSSDIRYLYQEDDGSYWIDLNAHYFGEMQFKMRYKEIEGKWFEWVYVDPEVLEDAAVKAGFQFKLLGTDGDHFLIELKQQ